VVFYYIAPICNGGVNEVDRGVDREIKNNIPIKSDIMRQIIVIASQTIVIVRSEATKQSPKEIKNEK